VKILKPIVGGHDGSSFREMLDIWKERKLCEVIDGPAPANKSLHFSQHPEARPWINSVGDIMLYDNPILDKLNEDLHWRFALWANEVKKDDGSPWVFWTKHPKIMEEMKFSLRRGWDERSISSSFIGTFTTGLRGQQDWSTSIEKFWMGNHSERIMSHPEYLNFLSHSKFGLCLPGVGPKCLRDVELMGLGTVPIFTPGCSLEYFDPPEHGVNCFKVSDPQEIVDLIENCTRSKWEEMSNSSVEWFERNCSAKGSFETTVKILDKFGVI
jgi:hypothetical protein